MAVSFLTLLLLLSSCSKTSKNNTLCMNLGTEPLTLDWNLANDMNSFDIISNLMIGLTRFGEDDAGRIISVPGCAKNWKINDQANEYVFYLYDDIRWTDGKLVTAHDFVDSFRRLLDPQTAAPYADLLSLIDLEQTQALDDFTLKIKLKSPAAYFIYLTSYGLTLPIRKDLIDKYGNDWTEPNNIVTNGPFKLKEWQHEYKIVLERNPDFLDHNQTTPVKNLVQELKYFMVQEQSNAFTLFINKQFDWIDNRSIPISELKKLNKHKNHPEYEVQQLPLLRNTYIGFNHSKKPFDNKLLRQAFSLAIDRELIKTIRSKGDTANNTLIPPKLGQYLDYNTIARRFEQDFGKEFNLNGYHPELARKILAEAGYPNGKNFPEVEMLIPNRDDAKLLAETLQALWKKELNITIKINAMEWKNFLTQLRDDPPPLFRLNWGADYPDPDTFMQLFSSQNQNNYGHWSNAKYDELIKTAAASTNLDLRRKLYTEAEYLISQDEIGIIPLYIDSQVIFKRSYVTGLKVNPMDIVFLDKVSLIK